MPGRLPRGVLIFVFAVFTLLLLGAGVFLILTIRQHRDDDYVALGMGLFFLVLALYLAHGIYRLTREPLIMESGQKERALMREGADELRNASAAFHDSLWSEKAAQLSTTSPAAMIHFANEILQKFPVDPYALYFKAYYQWKTGQPSEAATTIQLATSPSLPSVANFALTAARLQFLISSDQFTAAETLCEDWLQRDASLEEKIQVIEGLVAFHLYFEKLDRLEPLEKWIHRALALNPDSPSVKAILGGVLVEQGRYAEAELLILRRIASAPTHHGQAYAHFYLACIRAAQGKTRQARNLIDRATILSDADWLAARAPKKLDEISKNSS